MRLYKNVLKDNQNLRVRRLKNKSNQVEFILETGTDRSRIKVRHKAILDTSILNDLQLKYRSMYLELVITGLQKKVTQ